MTQARELSGAAESLARVPPGLAALMWPELPTLADEIIEEIRREIPEYARPMDGPYGQMLRTGVEHTIVAFVEQVADPLRPPNGRDEVCRKLGRAEAREGRSLDNLQAAYRIGSRVALHRITTVGNAHHFSSEVISHLAEGLVAYIDELATHSVAGYWEEKARSAAVVGQWRLRLLQMILGQPPAPADAIEELAAQVRWSVPETATLVAVKVGQNGHGPLPDRGFLTDLEGTQPFLLVPGSVDAPLCSAFKEAFRDGLVSVGPTVPLERAWQSLWLARRALALAKAKIICTDTVVYAEQHLLALWLLADETLLDEVAGRLLAPLMNEKLTHGQRERFTETLEALLAADGDVLEAASRLHVHEQTVRYRKRHIFEIFDDQLDDPDSRLMMELVLRATRLREQARARRQQEEGSAEPAKKPARRSQRQGSGGDGRQRGRRPSSAGS